MKTTTEPHITRLREKTALGHPWICISCSCGYRHSTTSEKNAQQAFETHIAIHAQDQQPLPGL